MRFGYRNILPFLCIWLVSIPLEAQLRWEPFERAIWKKKGSTWEHDETFETGDWIADVPRGTILRVHGNATLGWATLSEGTPEHSTFLWPEDRIQELRSPESGPMRALAIRAEGPFRIEIARETPQPMQAFRRMEDRLRSPRENNLSSPQSFTVWNKRFDAVHRSVLEEYPNASDQSLQAFLRTVASYFQAQDAPLGRIPFHTRAQRVNRVLAAGEQADLQSGDGPFRVRLSGEGRVEIRVRGAIRFQGDIQRGREFRGYSGPVIVTVERGSFRTRLDRWQLRHPLLPRIRPDTDALGQLVRLWKGDRNIDPHSAGPWGPVISALLYRDPQTWTVDQWTDMPSWLVLFLFERAFERRALPTLDCNPLPALPSFQDDFLSFDDDAIVRSLHRLSCGSISGLHSLLFIARVRPLDTRLLRLIRLARQSQRWMPIELSDGPQITTVRALQGDGICQHRPGRTWQNLEGSQRWRFFRPTRLRFRSLTSREHRATVNDLAIGIHGALGWTSRLTLPAGIHRAELPEGTIVNIPSSGFAPCNTLYDVRNERLLSPEVEYFPPLQPQVFLQVRVRANQPFEVRLQAGDIAYRLEGSERSAWVELPPFEGRFRAETVGSPRGETIEARTLVTHTATRRTRRNLPQTRMALLRRVRRASEALRNHDHRAAREQRARALWELGAIELALLDRPTQNFSFIRNERDLAAYFPPLEAENPQHLAAVRQEVEQGNRNALSRLSRGDAELSYLAREKERDGQLDRAMDIWAQTNFAQGRARAAELRYRKARKENDGTAALHAFVELIELAAEGAENARRIAAVRWNPLQAADHSAGTFWEPRDAAPTGFREILSAWLDAPQDAHILKQGERLVSQLEVQNSTTLNFRFGCAVDSTDCNVESFVDGVLSTHSTGTISLSLEPGRHRLDLRFSGDHGWIAYDAEFRPSLSALRFEITQDNPLRFRILGPTVVRVRGISPHSSRVEMDAQRVLVANAEDGFDLAVRKQGEAHISIFSSERARVSIHYATSLELQTPENEVELGTAPISSSFLPQRLREQIEDASQAGPLSLLTESRFVFGEVGALDARAQGIPYFEPSIRIFKRISFFRGELGTYVRFRNGPPSVGLFAQAELQGQGLRPSLLMRLRITGQSLENWKTGTRFGARITWNARLHPFVRFRPFAGIDLAKTPNPGERFHGLDPHVYTRWHQDHPWSLRTGAITSIHPFLDLRFQFQLETRTNAERFSFDRIDFRVRMDEAMGRTWAPWLGVEYLFSYRFSDPFRPYRIVRHMIAGDIEFWHWWQHRERWSVGARIEWIVDVHQLAGFLTLRHLFSPRRGVQDLRHGQTPFARRQHEGVILAP